MLKITALTCTLALCAAVSLSSLAQDTPPAAPPATTDKPAQKDVPSIEEGQELLGADQFEEAATVFHKIVKADPDNARAWHLLGFSLHSAGNLTDALPAHLMAAEFTQTAPIASYNVACVYSLRKKTDKAFKWLEKSRELGFNNREQVVGDTDLDNLRSDPRFAKYLESLQEAAPDGDMPAVEQHSGEDKPAPAKPKDGNKP